jgi:hypothetical protein
MSSPQQRRSIRPTGEKYLPAEQVEETILPAQYRNEPFVFVHYPGCWEWDREQKRMIPTLSAITGMRGVNGVGEDGKIHRALGSSVEKGGTPILPNDQRLGEWMGFITRYKAAGDPGQPNGWCYVFRSATFEILPGGRANPVDGSKEFREFRRYLLDHGIVPPIPVAVFNELRANADKALDGAIRVAQDNPHRAAKVDERRQVLAEMDAWWEREMNGEPEPSATPEAPAPRRRVRAAPEPAPEVDLTPSSV